MNNYQVCTVAIAPLRKEPSDRSEIVSQLLFGDRVKILQKEEKWCLVVTLHDNYEGWMDYKQLEKLSELKYNDEKGFIYVAPMQLENKLIATDGSKYYLTAGSSIPYYDNGFCYLGDQKFEVKFNPIIPDHYKIKGNIEQIAKFFQNAPYLWGGRTLFGIDCSGFVQIVYKLNGIQLNRDACQQAEKGEIVDFLTSAQVGDLAFFDNENGKITHVGLMIGNDKIIHSTGKVRIDPIDDQGIYNAELGKYTHKLRIIKRFF